MYENSICIERITNEENFKSLLKEATTRTNFYKEPYYFKITICGISDSTKKVIDYLTEYYPSYIILDSNCLNKKSFFINDLLKLDSKVCIYINDCISYDILNKFMDEIIKTLMTIIK